MTCLHAAATGVTILRIRIRWKYASLWWDDYLAIAATLIEVVFATVYWLRFGTHGKNLSYRWPPLR
jgi:hypothetical protein